MSLNQNHRSVLGWGSTVLLVLSAGLASCQGHAHSHATARTGAYTTDAMLTGQPASSYIVLDGDTADWKDGAVITANEHFVFVRFTVENEQYTLQSAPETTALMIDVDGDPGTGRTSDMAPMNALGVDLEIDFSPRGRNGPGHGVNVYTLDNAGHKTMLSAADIDFCVAPTYASSWYECRISRTPSNAGAMPPSGLLSHGVVRGIVATLDSTGKVDGFTDPFTVDVGQAAPGRFLSSQEMPSKPEGAVRLMEYNVEKSSPTSKPDQFRRIFQAIKPDVILLEEWEAGDAAALQTWFNTLVSTDAAWNVRKAEGTLSTGGGVAIVTKFPLVGMTGDALTLPGAAQGSTDHKVRFVAGRITTPYGELLTGCMHLKCCGTKDSSEDVQRMTEARAINSYFASASGAAGPAVMRVLGGDMNLVGSRPPLDLVRAGLDADGSDLAVVHPLVLGDWTLTTWRDPATEFSPGRLDYVTYSDANAQVVNAFVLDTSRLSDGALAKLGLEAGDCGGSDHLPVVVDLKPLTK